MAARHGATTMVASTCWHMQLCRFVFLASMLSMLTGTCQADRAGHKRKRTDEPASPHQHPTPSLRGSREAYGLDGARPQGWLGGYDVLQQPAAEQRSIINPKRAGANDRGAGEAERMYWGHPANQKGKETWKPCREATCWRLVGGGVHKHVETCTRGQHFPPNHGLHKC